MFKTAYQAMRSRTASNIMVAGSFGISIGMYIYFSFLRPSVTIKAKPAPPNLKSGPNPLVYTMDQLEDEGQGSGLTGRSAPRKKKIKGSGAVDLEGYLKTSPDERTHFLNELIYHRLAEKVLDYHPEIKLIEQSISETESEYSLFVQSFGRNLPAVEHFKQIKQPENEQMIISKMGAAIAFANLVRSTDAYLKNFVIVLHEDKKQVLKAYAIDFELISNADPILFADVSDKADADKTAENFIHRGAVLEYTENPTFSQRARAPEESDTDFGRGRLMYSAASYQIICDSVAEDIRNGNILTMYQQVAALTLDDIESLVDEVNFIFIESERDEYIRHLTDIRDNTRTHLDKIKPAASEPSSQSNMKNSNS